jgi:hypothetical protein
MTYKERDEAIKYFETLKQYQRTSEMKYSDLAIEALEEVWPDEEPKGADNG